MMIFRYEIYTSLLITYGKLKFQLKRERIGKKSTKGEKNEFKKVFFLSFRLLKEILPPATSR